MTGGKSVGVLDGQKRTPRRCKLYKQNSLKGLASRRPFKGKRERHGSKGRETQAERVVDELA